MRMTMMPKTSLGWWSVGLVIAIIMLFAGLVDILLGLFGLEVPVSGGPITSLERALAIGFAGISAAAFVTGLIGIVRIRERSILVFLSTAIGLFALIIAVGQAFGKTIGW